MRILVTGAAGLLGRVVVEDSRAAHDVFALTHRRGLPLAGVTAVQGDLEDTASLDRAWERARPDLVVHAGAIAVLEECEQDPARARRVNVDASEHLAGLSARHGARMVQVSTDAVFDGTSGPYTEGDVPAPRSTYASTKWEAEQRCLAVLPSAFVARVNFFGWSSTGARSLAEFFHTALAAGREVPGFTDVEFASLYNRDLASSLLEASGRGLSGVHHVVSSDRMSKYDFGVLVARVFGFDESLVRPGSVAELGGDVVRTARLSLDPALLAGRLGRPLPTIEAGLRRMAEDGRSGFPARLRDNQPQEATT